LKVNKQIRAPRLRVIDKEGNQLGILTLFDALARAEEMGLDLVEIAPSATPPVCKIVDFGKYRYQQTKKEKESKKAQHQVKLKEVKVKPHTDEHDLQTKLRHAKRFLLEGNKVKITCVFRGREMFHPEFGQALINRICDNLSEISTIEAPPKLFGKILAVVIVPKAKKKINKDSHAKNEAS